MKCKRPRGFKSKMEKLDKKELKRGREIMQILGFETLYCAKFSYKNQILKESQQFDHFQHCKNTH